jgi:Holliday junction resolvase-like predicted endonuclease|tara:strand:- start:292 stop:582 length:291 start_codon:yes stop_codon:yes gene_type:complete
MNEKITDTNRLGDIAEFYVTTWLWDEGYEVFRNAGCTGAIDLVALRNGVPVFIDVKSKNTDTRYGHSRTEEQKLLRVQLVEFNGQTRKCRWVEHEE